MTTTHRIRRKGLSLNSLINFILVHHWSTEKMETNYRTFVLFSPRCQPATPDTPEFQLNYEELKYRKTKTIRNTRGISANN